ncbi:MAG: hypothetical protein C0412_02525 [Flavobacterium sp.]|nr:hypothetical protein [Flavobacterium sp.]
MFFTFLNYRSKLCRVSFQSIKELVFLVDAHLICLAISTVFLFFLSYLKSCSFLNPVGLLTLVWGGWLFISNFSFTGLIVPSRDTQYLFLLAIVAMNLGSLLVGKITNRNNYDDLQSPRLKFLFYCVNILVLPIIGYLSFETLKVILRSGLTGLIYLTRSVSPEEGGGVFVLFGKGYLRTIFTFISYPFLYSSIFIGSAAYFLRFKKKLFFVSIFLMCTYSFIMTAREGILLIFFLSAYGSMLLVSRKDLVPLAHKKQVKRFGQWIVVICIGLIIVLSQYRMGEGRSFAYMVVHYGVTYHTLGFTMFDIAYRDEKSYLNKNLCYGRATLNLPDQLFEILSRRIDEQGVRSVAREVALLSSERIFVGYDKTLSGGKIFSNAFYTVLYPFYLDGRIFGVFLFPFVYGFFLMKFFLHQIKNQDIYSFAMVLFLFFTGYTSLFSTSILLFYYWVSFLIIWSFGNLKLGSRRCETAFCN